jgi:hypothetical protein
MIFFTLAGERGSAVSWPGAGAPSRSFVRNSLDARSCHHAIERQR